MKLPELKQKFTAMPKNQKILAVVVALLIVLDIVAAIALIAGKHKSAVHLACIGSDESIPFYAIDSSANKGTIKDSGYADFKFTQKQKELFYKIYQEKGSVALAVCIQVMPAKKQIKVLQGDAEVPFNFGYLSKDDFTSKGKLKKQYYPGTKRIQVQGDLRNAPEIFDLSFAIQKNDEIEKYLPEGFFIYSSVRCRILGACVVPAEIGFDVSKEIPFYGYACNGGVIDFTNSWFDFSGSSMVFPVQANVHQSLPEYSLTLSDSPEYKTNNERSVRIELNIGGEKLFVSNVSSAKEIIIPAGALNAPFARVELGSNHECVEAFIMKGVKAQPFDEVITPVRTDPGLILNYKTKQWRTVDYEIYEWDRYPGILFFDTRNYEVQDRFFRRLAFFVEKQGYKGRLLTNEEIGDMHGYNAHDYSAQSMAKFFNKAADLNFTLNEEELLLKRILIQNGLFEDDGIYVKANEGGLVSISRETPGWSRINLLAHEGWHTIFFRDAEFRNFVSAVYYTFDPTSLEFLIDYFKSQPSLGYDINDEYLMHNEFMAYIMQNRLSEVSKYFVHLANRGSVINFTPQLAAYIRKTEGRGFEDAAIALNDFVFDKYGIVCGNIALVNR